MGMNAHDLILIIDMQNVYLPGQPWGCATFRRSCGRIRALLDAAAAERDAPSVCFTKFISDPDAAGMWARYNELNREINADPWMSELVDELKPYAERCPVYRKSVYSSMAVPAVRRAAERAGRLVVAGVVSECCVLSTCMEAVDLGFHIVYLRDACSGIDASREAAVLHVLSALTPPHVTVTDVDSYLAEPGSRPRPASTV